MLPRIRIFFLCILLGGAAAELPQARELYSHLMEGPDNRPVVSVLFLGNSRTRYNDMPYMVSKIADSAHSPRKYQITMIARDGATLRELWNDSEVQDALGKKWDYVVLQGGSSEQINDTMIENFMTYGTKLVNAAKARESTPVLLVAWRCSDSYYPQIQAIGGQRFYEMIQSGYANLAQTTGAASVNVGRIWETLQSSSSQPLTVDGNHPTMRGSYLVALMFYHFFSGDDLAHVTYAPPEVTPEDAGMLKAAAQSE
jgi:hypothetical protein